MLKSAKKDDSNLAREIHHHRQFVHPHIARLYEVIVTESLVWLVLEYCPGDELYNYLLKHGRLPVEKVQNIFTQLVGAVSYVHQQSCVHRDLKLENILLDKHENVKLCDFGFTREYEGKANYLQTFCGTICYSAPEMLKGEKYAGEKVDVWSLGVILYALLCGELPFDEDEDDETRRRILFDEPKYPDFIPADALALIKKLLSKRTLLRPSIPEILADPFLADFAPQQQEILGLRRPAPFATSLEKDTLERMKSAGVDIDSVIESVLAQRCDALAGWWALLLEKEGRKVQRRERKRKEREADNRSSRRFSQASSRLNALATVGEEYVRLSDPLLPRTRGRSTRRRSGLMAGDFTRIGESSRSVEGPRSPDSDVAPPPIDKDSIRSVSTSRQRKPLPPPKEGVLRSARSRGSTLHLVTTSEALTIDGSASQDPKKVKKRPSQAILASWKSFSHWIFENTRRHKSATKRGSQSAPNLLDKPQQAKEKNLQDGSPRPQTGKGPAGASGAALHTAGLPEGLVANGFAGSNAPKMPSGTLQSPTSTTVSSPTIPNPPPRVTSKSYKRQSLSPQPLTPRSTVRRTSGAGISNLRGRKSTSSSVSSIRSIHHAHHHHSHSKASSTSSNGSVTTTMSKTPLQTGRSPHHSVKVLPATPTTAGFPSNIRLVRDRSGPPLSIFNEGMPSHNSGLSAKVMPAPPVSPSPFGGPFNWNSPTAAAPGVLFAKRKKNLFKGPMLSLGREAKSSGSGSASHSRSASASGLGRRSGEITIQEEDEEAVEEGEAPLREGDVACPVVGEDDVEEVDSFAPVLRGPGETIEEKIYEQGEGIETEEGLQPPAEVIPGKRGKEMGST